MMSQTINQERETEIAVDRIVGFAQVYGEGHLDLAFHAAFPLVLTPDLLYQIWAYFCPEVPWTAVARILLSQLCSQVGHEMYEMNLTVRNLLLRSLKKYFGQERLEKLSQFLLDYIRQDLVEDDLKTQQLKEAQRWTALVYVKPDQAARELRKALEDKFGHGDIADAARIASLIETLAEPLEEAGFEPLLTYSRKIKRAIYRPVEKSNPQETTVSQETAEPEDIQSLISGLRHPDMGVQNSAIKALQGTTDPKAIQALISLSL